MKLSQQIYYTFYSKKKNKIKPEYYSPNISIFNTLSSFFLLAYLNFFLFNLKQILPHDR